MPPNRAAGAAQITECQCCGGGVLCAGPGAAAAGTSLRFVGGHALAAKRGPDARAPASGPDGGKGGHGKGGPRREEDGCDRELMTGYVESGPPMPLSIVTIGSLADLGYLVDYMVADPFSFPGNPSGV